METLVRIYNRFRARGFRDEKAGVERPHRLRVLVVWDALSWLFCGAVAWAAIFHTPDHRYLHATLVLLATFPLMAVMRLRRRRCARAYSRGWLDGRMAMIASIEECMRRRIPPEQWVWLEVERDQKVIDHL